MRPPVVFVVDDEEQICALLTRTLARDGSTVQAFSSANAALAAIGTTRPDLLVTDMMMPELSGLELAQRAKAILPELSVVLITGYASIENVLDAMRSGIDDFVTKPFSASEIRAVVSRVLERRGQRAEPKTAEVIQAAASPRPPENAALVRRLRDMALLEAVHRILAEEMESREILARLRSTFESALGVSRAALAVPGALPGSFRLAALADGALPPADAVPDVAFLDLVMASGNATPCSPGDIGPIVAHLDTGPVAAAPIAARDAAADDMGVLLVSRPAFGRRFEGDDLRVVGVVAAALGDVWRSVRAAERAEEIYVATLRDVAEASEMRTPWFRDHGERVARIAVGLARRLGMPQQDLDTMEIAARLLDIGRIEIPDEVLTRPGRLSNEEWRFVRSHCDAADQIVRPLGRLRHVKPVLLHHHENWDGSGYPNGLRGDEIPPLAAVARIADTYAALVAPRPWRQAMDESSAVRKIVDASGSHFHPQFVAAFTEMHFEAFRTPGGTA